MYQSRFGWILSVLSRYCLGLKWEWLCTIFRVLKKKEISTLFQSVLKVILFFFLFLTLVIFLFQFSAPLGRLQYVR
jgi:hypothetical protein